METTVQRFIGTCQICEGEFKLDLNALMVHHGYKRPGYGYIVGDCQAVGHPAYEQSCELLKSYTESLRLALDNAQEHLRQLEAGEIQKLTVTRRAQPLDLTFTYQVGDAEWPRTLGYEIDDKKFLIRILTRDISRCEARIAAWKLLPLRTIEEEQAAQRASKEEAKDARDARKAAKLQAKIDSYRKRIDTAVRRHTTSTLGDIFESAPSKLREIAGYDKLTAAEALTLLERNHVWLAFGLDITLPKPERDAKSPNAEICRNMRYPQYRFPETKKYPWPEDLK